MADNIFKYPGGKTTLSPWILEQFRDHKTYVEVFGGSGAVLVNKNPSTVEVFNDRDGDIVHFFETLRDRPAELVEWLRNTPHSRELHERYASEFYDGVRPDDDVVRAGRFFYLRETQFAAKYTEASGYNGSAGTNPASNLSNKRDRLEQWSRRFDNVQVECLDYADLLDRYDSPDTLFYCDPPYVKEGDDLYSHGEFDHAAFVDALSQIEGDWVVSYTDLPDGLAELSNVVLSTEHRYRMAQGQREWDKTNTERLALSYDPRKVPLFGRAGQTSVEDF